jgi:hypothetical protein
VKNAASRPGHEITRSAHAAASPRFTAVLAARGMANVQNLDNLPYSIEYLVRIADDEHHSDLGVVCSVPTQGMLAQLRYGIANARSDISSANWRTFSQVLNDLLAV